MYNLLLEYIKKNNSIPSSKTQYKDQNIGMWLQTQKSKINDQYDELYIKLSENNILKEYLDKYIKNKEANKDKEHLTWAEWHNLLLEYIKENKSIPYNKTQYGNKNIGTWLQTQKIIINNKDDELYIKLSKNNILKECLDEYIKNKEARKTNT